jgi:site-specific DNA recombinase
VEEIETLVAALGDLVRILRDADAAARQGVYQTLGVRLVYVPQKREIRVEANLDPDRIVLSHDPRFGETVRVRGGT